MSPLPKITISTPYDLTPAGARRVYVMPSGKIRGYLSGRRFAVFPTPALALAWRDNREMLAPQPWETFQ